MTDEKTERKKDEKEEKKSFFRQLSGNIFDKDVYYAFSVGIHLVLCTFAGPAMGYGLDSLFGTKPWLSFLFLVFGIIAPLVAGLLLALQQQPDGTTPADAYLPLFVMDALTSLIFAFIIWRRLRETKPQVAGQPTTAQMARGSGYGRVFRDSPFMIFVVLFGLVAVVYSQMNTTFGVHLTRTYGFQASAYTAMLSTNAALVVLFQFPLARWVDQQDRSKMLALGAALYAIGFGMIGFISTLYLFWVAVVILTIGEMVIVPAAQTVTADLAPIDMRGRYQAAFGLINNFFYGLGPVIGGFLFDIHRQQPRFQFWQSPGRRCQW